MKHSKISETEYWGGVLAGIVRLASIAPDDR